MLQLCLFIKDQPPSYPGSSRGLWRLKLVLAYCLFASLLVCLGVFLRLAVSLALHWNTEVSVSEIPRTQTTPAGGHEPPALLGDVSGRALPGGDGRHQSPRLLAPSRSLKVAG